MARPEPYCACGFRGRNHEHARPDKTTIVRGLEHAARWIRSEEHDDFCQSLEGPFKMCDCGKVLALEQIKAARTEICAAISRAEPK